MAIAGVDEVGRGAVFGMVLAAAVSIQEDQVPYLQSLGVTDSKRLSPKRREELSPIIQTITDWGIGSVSVAEIAKFNVLDASLLAMERAIAQLHTRPCHCLVDGNQKLKFQEITPIPQTTIIKGDTKFLSIAAASIIAKVERDRLISELGLHYPEYDLEHNKGYGTAKHRAAIAKYGLTPWHRVAFCQKLIQPN